MNPLLTPRLASPALLLASALLLAGCGKKEQAALPSAPEVATKPADAEVATKPAATPAPAATASAPTATPPSGDALAAAKPAAPAPAPTPTRSTEVAPPASALVSSLAPAAFKLTDLKIPDFQQAPVADISAVAVQALAGLKQTLAAAAPTPAATSTTTAPAGVAATLSSALAKVDDVKSAVLGGQPTVALEKLNQLTDFVKTVPGGEAVLNTSKQLVSAWALKQGFDVAKISGVLGALQSRDYASLASQAAGLLAKGGVSGEQKNLLSGVLNAFGLDANNPAAAVNAVKGLFGK